jgi:hypothetical protein
MIDYNEARLMFISALAEETGLPVQEIVSQYREGGELKRRIDLAAQHIAGEIQDFPPSLSGRGKNYNSTIH